MLAIASAVLCLLSVTPGMAVEDSITIKFVPTQGRVLTYSAKGFVTIQGKDRDVDATRLQTILSVSPDGSYKSKWEERGVTVDDTAAPDQPEETTVSKPSGELISIDTPDLGQTAALDRLYYPLAPVKVGDAWSFAGKQDPKLGVAEFKADMKLLGEEKVGEVDAWKIREDLKESGGDAPAVIHDVIWVDKKDGSIVKLETKFTNYRVTSNVPFPIDGSFTYIRK